MTSLDFNDLENGSTFSLSKWSEFKKYPHDNQNDEKYNNLQYNTLGRWVDRSLTKYLMVQVLF